jgi:channel protein (hemolysin III family)
VTELHHLPGLYEPFNAISHLLAAGLFVVLGARLVGRAAREGVDASPLAHRFCLSVYAVACVFLLSTSAVFHMMVRGSTASQVMERVDHGAIFVLIAGTFTGVHGVLFRGWMRWGPIAFVWAVTAACITLKTVYFESLPEWVGFAFYLGLGWGVAITAIPIFRRFGLAYLAPLFLGGLAYSIGAFMELMGWFVVIPGVVHAHEIWHLAVLAGAILHWSFVWKVAVEGSSASATWLADVRGAIRGSRPMPCAGAQR